MRVFGYIRFSYLGRSDALMSRVPDQSRDEHHRRLFDPARMEARFHFFERICLPSIKGQSDPDFRVFVMASQDMDASYKARLEAAVADTPQIQICYSDAPRLVDAFAPFIKRETSDLTENSIHFRLDDDDAIGTDLVSNLRKMALYAEPGTLLSLPRGYYLVSHEGRAYLLPKVEAYIAIGFAFVCAPARIRNPYSSSHKKTFLRVPSALDPRPFSYIHVAHEASDTRRRQNRRALQLLKDCPDYDTPQFQKKLAENFDAAFPHTSVEEMLHALTSAPEITPA